MSIEDKQLTESGKMTWKQFYFESNMFFDNIAGPEDWMRLKAAYPTMTDDELLDAKEATYGGRRTIADRYERPNCGLRSEHDGVKRLRDFFEDNDMLRLIPCHPVDTSKQREGQVMSDFVEFPKMARLKRECIITEKIDGTNACVKITEDGQFLTGSRTRWITPDDDNYGFSKWAHDHKEELLGLGVGTHFGEWWGSGCQRGYGLTKGEKRWSLFNVGRWCMFGSDPQRIPTADPRIEKWQGVLPACCYLVPVLYRGEFDTRKVNECLAFLRHEGSQAAPGFMRPEGVVCFHVAGNVGFKTTLEKDDEYKGKK